MTPAWLTAAAPRGVSRSIASTAAEKRARAAESGSAPGMGREGSSPRAA